MNNCCLKARVGSLRWSWVERRTEILRGIAATNDNHRSNEEPVKFYHAYDNYMTYAFPHDELKPLAKTFTDSLVKLGNLKCNIRVLGGLVSTHILATDSTTRLVQRNYKNQLLILPEDLRQRILPAFDTPTRLPYAWINLKICTTALSLFAAFDSSILVLLFGFGVAVSICFSHNLTAVPCFWWLLGQESVESKVNGTKATVVPTEEGLGLLRAILDWEHFFSSFGCGKHFTWTLAATNMNDEELTESIQKLLIVMQRLDQKTAPMLEADGEHFNRNISIPAI
ncbi:Alpha-mannosidase I MNS5 [Camellia lanceoleosa]|uniref:Alpha-mannosidase I MNS5 n=1 Tax=Camellia lanceoleosa TaxID=1840588 RepID=A0ACC0FAZ9_9ERIC|nr:Alpha-mannosidase I MNS5 [Camellia lanceoleosa]